MPPLNPAVASTSGPARHRVTFACGIAACLACLLVLSSLPAAGQRPPATVGGGQLVVSTSPLPDARHLVVVIDPGTRHAAVYLVDQEGTLSLKAARDLTWDLMVGEFNAQEPKPAAIRRLLEAGQPPR